MTAQPSPPAPEAPALVWSWGFWALILGGIAMALVFLQIALPMTEAKPSVGTQIGEIAGDIRRSAWRSLVGLAPEAVEPEPVPMTVYLAMIAPVLGVMAIVLAAVSGVRRENRRLWLNAAALGVGAVVFQYLWWMVLLIAGVVLLVSIISNMDGIFGL